MDMSGIRIGQSFQVVAPSVSAPRFSLGDQALAQVTTGDFYSPGGNAPAPQVDTEKAQEMIFEGKQLESDRVKWDFDAKVPEYGITYNPVIGPDGTIYAEYDLTGLIALDGVTGDKKWSVRTRVYNAGPQLTPGGTIVAWGGKRVGDYALSGFDPQDGHEKWRIASHDHGIEGLVQGPGGLIVAGNLRPGELVGLDGDTGREKWSQKGYRGAPVMAEKDGGTLYMQEGFEKIHVLDGRSGKKKFVIDVKKQCNESFFTIDCSPGGDVATLSTSGRLLMFDGETGKKKWDLSAKDSTFVPNITWGPDGTVYFCTGAEEIYALDGNTGARKWLNEGNIPARQIVVGTNGDVFAMDHRGLHALDGATGRAKWEFTTKESPSSITLAPDGALILTESRGTIHSIVYDEKKLAEKRKKEEISDQPSQVESDGQYIIIDDVKIPIRN
jgi:outer membrane protein assembly factor BamB